MLTLERIQLSLLSKSCGCCVSDLRPGKPKAEKISSASTTSSTKALVRDCNILQLSFTFFHNVFIKYISYLFPLHLADISYIAKKAGEKNTCYRAMEYNSSKCHPAVRSSSHVRKDSIHTAPQYY